LPLINMYLGELESLTAHVTCLRCKRRKLPLIFICSNESHLVLNDRKANFYSS
jgi:hypothetical protein